jgi:UDP-N-acetylmuramoyl-tripeptide--D-alanyl-D-alanine ligase
MKLDASAISAVCAARIEGDLPSFKGYSIDTRSIAEGELFFALRGPNFDGHSFVPAALAKGAGAVVEMGYAHPEPLAAGKALLRVEDPFQALRKVAVHVREALHPKVVGITGSMGKTTTKEMTAAVLSRALSVHRTEGNLNNMIGLPLVLARLPESTEVAVLEMGMSYAGEISVLSRMARPDVGLITSVAPVHLMNFNSIEGIKEAKGEILDGMGIESAFVANGDDDRVMELSRRHGGRVVTYSLDRESASEVRLLDLQERSEGTRFRLASFGETVEIDLPLPGRHNAQNFLAAAAVGAILGIPVTELSIAARMLRAASHRGQVRNLPDGTLLYDDCYNSSPQAVRAGYRAFEAIAGERRRIAVLGEMLELGPSSRRLHHEVGSDLADRFDLLIAVRGDAEAFVEGAKEASRNGVRAEVAADADEAAALLMKSARPGDAIFVKGSRGVRLDRVVDRIVGGGA